MRTGIIEREQELRSIGYSSYQIQKLKEIEEKYALNYMTVSAIKTIKQKFWEIYLDKLHETEKLKADIDNLTNYIDMCDIFME